MNNKQYLTVPLDYLEDSNIDDIISLFQTYKNNGWEKIESITHTDNNCYFSSFMTLSKRNPNLTLTLKEKNK
jgi:hypothetical protein